MLDMDGGAPWDLLCSLMQAAPGKRLSASAAAAHPALGGGLTGALNSALWRLGEAADKVSILSDPFLCWTDLNPPQLLISASISAGQRISLNAKPSSRGKQRAPLKHSMLALLSA